MFNKTFVSTLFGLLAADLLSFLASYDVWVTSAVGIALAMGMLVLAFRRLDVAFLVVIAELVHGSQGHLFEIHLGIAEIPIRMALFGAFMLGWLFVRAHKPTDRSVGLWWYVLFGAVVYGVFIGLASGNSIGSVFTDADAYGYLLLILPALEILRRSDDEFRNRITSVIVAAGLATVVITVAVHLLYTLDVSFLRHLYVWIRDWGLGEVTPPGHAVFNRIFFQSHLWVLIALLLTLAKRRCHDVVHDSMAGLLLATIFLSFSRSLWLGAAVGIVIAVIMNRRSALRTLVVAVPIALIVVTLIAPATLGRALGRTTAVLSEPAAASRWSLLPVLWGAIRTNPIVGYGFGTARTYQTKDPKLIAELGTDQYTTFAFEWGYLEQWFKMGLLGIVAIIGLLVAIGRRILCGNDPAIRAWLFSGLVAVALVSITSPYLNHPLGLGFLIIAYVLTEQRGAVST